MKSFLKGVLSFFLVVIIVVGGFIGYEAMQLRAVNKVKEDVVFTVDEGSSANGVLYGLYQEGLIRNYSVSRFYTKLFGAPSIKAGTFVVNDSMSTLDLLDYLADESHIYADSVTVTLIEGSGLPEMASRICDATNLEETTLLAYWNDATVFQSLMKDYSVLTSQANSASVKYLLEGYLFPDTYQFLKMTTCDEVTRKLLNQTQYIYEKYADEFGASSLSTHEVFTLASVVQWEANSYEDMEKVAGVFLKRLNGGCNSQIGSARLESSVTLCYAADIPVSVACELNDTRESTKNSPYNTYYHSGLMPGPICAPGEDAIHAVLTPDSNNYCFFFADAEGVHYSQTYIEHQANY